ncbi:hypothetical protein WR25_12560 [Diploscapter pachys]|uniref:Uncharacterized protein n=1 Tax=Diploscapter pachys TaxID=2018661 RepID=A0A2A2M427_9BILA|nr:hypothetical protein WR25_12560 [Diploscapter pachys]
MFNTILLELLGYGVANVSSSEDGDRYINSFYLTDASNMLLVVHSATNWLLFYRWPKCATTSNPTFMSTSLTTSLKSLSIRSRVSDYISRRVSNCKHLLGNDIVARLCFEMPEIYHMLLKGDPSRHATYESLLIDNEVQKIGEKVGNYAEQVFRW